MTSISGPWLPFFRRSLKGVPVFSAASAERGTEVTIKNVKTIRFIKDINSFTSKNNDKRGGLVAPPPRLISPPCRWLGASQRVPLKLGYFVSLQANPAKGQHTTTSKVSREKSIPPGLYEPYEQNREILKPVSVYLSCREKIKRLFRPNREKLSA